MFSVKIADGARATGPSHATLRPGLTQPNQEDQAQTGRRAVRPSAAGRPAQAGGEGPQRDKPGREQQSPARRACYRERAPGTRRRNRTAAHTSRSSLRRKRHQAHPGDPHPQAHPCSRQNLTRRATKPRRRQAQTTQLDRPGQRQVRAHSAPRNHREHRRQRRAHTKPANVTRPRSQTAKAQPPVRISTALTPRGVQASPKASATAAAQAPYRSMTGEGAGHSAACSRLSASPPRRRAWVRDQSYDDGATP
jgi:hypothetical protein